MTGPVDKSTPTGAAGKAEEIDHQPKARVIAQPALDTKSLTVRQSSAILGALNPDSPIADDAKDRILSATVSESTITLTPSKTVATADAVTLDFNQSNATQAIHMTLNDPDQNVTQIVIGNNGAFSLSVLKHLIAAYPNLQTIQMDLAPYILPALQRDIQTSPEDRAAKEQERISEIEQQHAAFVRPTSIAPDDVTLDLTGNTTITNRQLRDLTEQHSHLENILLKDSSIYQVIKDRIKARIDFNTALSFFNSDRLPLKLSTVFNAGMISDFKIPFQSQTAVEIDTLLDKIEQNPEQAAFITDLSFAENINFHDRHLQRLATLSNQLKHLTRLDITDTGVTKLPDSLIAFTNLKTVYETSPPFTSEEHEQRSRDAIMASLNASPRKDLEAGITPVILPPHIKEQLADLWVTETFEEFLIHYAKAKYDVRKQNRDARMARLAAHMAILEHKAIQNLEQHLKPKAEK